MNNDGWNFGASPGHLGAGSSRPEDAGAIFDGEPMMVLVEVTAPLEETAIVLSAPREVIEASSEMPTGLGIVAVESLQPVLLFEVRINSSRGGLTLRSALNPLSQDGRRMIETWSEQDTFQLLLYTPKGEPVCRRIVSLDHSMTEGLKQTLALCDGVSADEHAWHASIKRLDEAGMLEPGAGLQED